MTTEIDTTFLNIYGKSALTVPCNCCGMQASRVTTKSKLTKPSRGIKVWLGKLGNTGQHKGYDVTHVETKNGTITIANLSGGE